MNIRIGSRSSNLALKQVEISMEERLELKIM